MNDKSNILIVEDGDEDFETTIRAFRQVRMGNEVIRCNDGDSALDYLFRRGLYVDPASSPRPTLILLDLNLPGTDGREVLRKIKESENLRMIPVIVLTTSSDERDINKCYDLGANSFVQKPVSFDRFVESIRKIRDFWFEIVLFPEGKR